MTQTQAIPEVVTDLVKAEYDNYAEIVGAPKCYIACIEAALSAISLMDMVAALEVCAPFSLDARAVLEKWQGVIENGG